jgi:hypothetical protein
MEMSTSLVIILSVITIFIQYVIIETAVRRGIDSSETHQLLKEILENEKKKKEQS